MVLVQYIKEGLDGRPVEWYSDVYDLIFKDVDPVKAGKMWSEQLREKDEKKKELDN